MALIDSILPAIEHFRMLGYWVVLLVALLESLAFVGIVVPGAVFVVLTGSLAAKGYFDIGDLIWFASVGAILGDGISFRFGQRSHLLFREENLLFKPSHLERGREYFTHHGGVSVFLARFIGPIRAVVPFVAGLSGMSFTTFTLWNVAGGLLWSISHLLAGYLLGEAWRAVEIWATRFGAVLAVILLITLSIFLLKRFLEKRGRHFIVLATSVVGAMKKAIITDPAVQNFIEKHPDLFAFIGKRLERNRFFGLPLTLLAGAFFYVLLLLGGVVEDLLTADPIVAADVRIENLLYAFRDPAMVKVLFWVTRLGTARMVVAVALTLCAILALWRKRTFIIPLAVTLAGSTATALLGKLAFHRPRPAGVAVYTETSYSFPSGHAVIAAALYGFTAYLLWRHAKTWGRRLNILFTTLFLVAAIGFSRLYLGVHFLSDVLGGYLVGLLWLIIGISLAEWRLASEEAPTPAPLPGRVRLAAAIVITALLAFYVQTGINYQPAPPPTGTASGTLPVLSADIPEAFSRHRLPRHIETIIGEKQEPMSFIITAGDEEELITAFGKAGWPPVDPVSFAAVTRTAWAALSSGHYRSAPLTPAFWDGRPNDLGFAKTFPSPGGETRREEARVWRTPLRTDRGKEVYVGVAQRIVGYKWGIFPEMGADLDQARDDLAKDLAGSGRVSGYLKIGLSPPSAGRTLSGAPFFSDGAAWIITIRNLIPAVL